MSPGLGDYLLIGAIAAVVTAVATPIVRFVARRRGWVVAPNARSVHTSPIPHVGGLAMMIGFLAAFLTAWALGRFDVIFDDNSEPMGVLIAALIVFATGLLDDIARHGAARQGHRRRAWRARAAYFGATCSTSASRSSTS